MSEEREPEPQQRQQVAAGQSEVERELRQGRLALSNGEQHAAAASFATAARLAQMLGDRSLELTALNLEAQAVHALGQPQSALQILSRGLKRLAAHVDPEQAARVHSNVGQLQREFGNLAEALEQLLRAQELFEAAGTDGRPLAVNLINMGQLYQDLGRHHEAGEFLQRAHQAGLESGDGPLVAVALNNLANGDLATGDLFVARERFEAALQHAQELDMTEYVVDNLDGLGETLGRLGDHERALQVHGRALEVARSEGSRSGELDALSNLGRDHLQLGEPDRAISLLQEALGLATALQRRTHAFELHNLLSQAYEEAGDPWAALSHSREAQELQELVSAERHDERLRELKVKHRLARAQQEADRYRLRTELMKQSIAEAENRVRQRTDELERSHLEALERLALAAEYRDDGTGAHTRRVGRNAAAVAYALGFSLADARELYIAAKLHDVGKIAVPDAVLYKPGALDEQERQLIRQHPEVGARLLQGSASPLLQRAALICLHHHEHFDGSGYPQQLRGEEIPLAARIVAAADVLDALTHERPYKPAWSVAEALAELRAQAGRQLDPLVVDVCLTVFGSEAPVTPLEDVATWGDVRRTLGRVRPLKDRPSEPLFP